MEIKLHTNPNCFQALHDEWLELLQHSVVSSVFQSPAFLESWWEIYGTGKLHLLTFHDNEKLVGLAPLYSINKETQNILTFIGDRDITDIQDFIIHSSHIVQVYEELQKYLHTHKEIWDHLDLFSVPESSPTVTLLNAELGKKTIVQQPGFDDKTQQSYMEVTPIIDLPETWVHYLESLERKQRHEVRRKFKKLTENLDHEFKVVEDTISQPDAINTFISLHKASADYKESFWDKKREAFFKKFLDRLSSAGWLKLFFLEVEGQPVASMLSFDYNDQYQLYNSGYDASKYRSFSTGQVLTTYTIKHAIERGRKQYNFLRGNQEYKFRLGGKPYKIFDLKIS